MRNLPATTASSGSPRSEAPEIHRYPLRPTGFKEPLFGTKASNIEIMEHLLASDWLFRASELDTHSGSSRSHPGEPVRVERGPVGVEIHRTHRRRLSWSRSRVVEVIERSREVARWWDEASSVDRYVFKVLLSTGPVVSLSLERFGGWSMIDARG